MATSISISTPARCASPRSAVRLFAVAAVALALGSWLLAGWAPVGFSIVTVFLFAGPHNWMEGRYLMSRMPARWGLLRPYFLTGIAGVIGLTAAFAALPAVARWQNWSDEQWLTGLAAWNTGLVVWLSALVWMRSRQNPRRDWNWVFPIGGAIVALAWLSPQEWDLALVYLHPLIAMWFLDREIGLRRPEFRSTYRMCLGLVAGLVILLWIRLSGSASLPGTDLLTIRITSHAGAGLLTGVSSHLLVSTHTFLEMLHYSIWLVAIPLVSVRTWPWRIGMVPLARRSAAWRRALTGVLILGAAIIVVLWAGFLANYPLTARRVFHDCPAPRIDRGAVFIAVAIAT